MCEHALSDAHRYLDQLAEAGRRSECACKHKNGLTSQTKSPLAWNEFDSSRILYGKVPQRLGIHFFHNI